MNVTPKSLNELPALVLAASLISNPTKTIAYSEVLPLRKWVSGGKVYQAALRQLATKLLEDLTLGNSPTSHLVNKAYAAHLRALELLLHSFAQVITSDGEKSAVGISLSTNAHGASGFHSNIPRVPFKTVVGLLTGKDPDHLDNVLMEGALCRLAVGTPGRTAGQRTISSLTPQPLLRDVLESSGLLAHHGPCVQEVAANGAK